MAKQDSQVEETTTEATSSAALKSDTLDSPSAQSSTGYSPDLLYVIVALLPIKRTSKATLLNGRSSLGNRSGSCNGQSEERKNESEFELHDAGRSGAGKTGAWRVVGVKVRECAGDGDV